MVPLGILLLSVHSRPEKTQTLRIGLSESL
jgi:hypothetical protein